MQADTTAANLISCALVGRRLIECREPHKRHYVVRLSIRLTDMETASHATDFARAEFGTCALPLAFFVEVLAPRLQEQLPILGDRCPRSRTAHCERSIVRFQFYRIEPELAFIVGRLDVNVRKLAAFVAVREEPNRPTRRTVGTLTYAIIS